jgi:hypothetical protein
MPAPDGTRLEVLRLPRPAPIENRPASQGACAEAVVSGGYAEITVAFRDDCAPGEAMGIVLHFEGRLPITARATPDLEWRAVLPGEAGIIEAVVRPIPPPSSGEADSVVRPPDTGDAGLSSSR